MHACMHAYILPIYKDTPIIRIIIIDKENLVNYNFCNIAFLYIWSEETAHSLVVWVGGWVRASVRARGEGTRRWFILLLLLNTVCSAGVG